MASKCKIIYGIVWKDSFNEALDDKKPEDFGFIRVSSKKSNFKGFLGSSLYDISTLDVPVDLNRLFSLQPNKTDIKKINESINKLPESLKIQIDRVSVFCLFY